MFLTLLLANFVALDATNPVAVAETSPRHLRLSIYGLAIGAGIESFQERGWIVDIDASCRRAVEAQAKGGLCRARILNKRWSGDDPQTIANSVFRVSAKQIELQEIVIGVSNLAGCDVGSEDAIARLTRLFGPPAESREAMDDKDAFSAKSKLAVWTASTPSGRITTLKVQLRSIEPKTVRKVCFQGRAHLYVGTASLRPNE